MDFNYPQSNRIVMSPMTRCRAIGNIPNELMVEYYTQRSGGCMVQMATCLSRFVLEVVSAVAEHIGKEKTAIILSGGYNLERAEADIEDGLANLVDRFKNKLPLSQDLRMDLFYTAENLGYTDYPNYTKSGE